MSKVFCLDQHNNYVETMSKEDIIAAIQTAAEGGNLEGFSNTACITKIKEINKNGELRIWVGTTAEYNAIASKRENVLYLISDEDARTEYLTAVNLMREELNRYSELTVNQAEAVKAYEAAVKEYTAAAAEYKTAAENASGRMQEIETNLAESKAYLEQAIKEVAPQVIFENTAGATICLTSTPITDFREIKIAFVVTDTEENETRAYQQSFFVNDIAGEFWLQGCKTFTYTNNLKKIVNTVARFTIENNENGSALSLGEKATNANSDAADYSSRFTVGITKIYGVGKREG
jgi:hypothetical protein